jgi:hypothetical protein
MVMVVMPMISTLVGGEVLVRYDWHSICYLVAVVALVMLGMSHVVAEEYFQFNVESAWVGENTPAFLET